MIPNESVRIWQLGYMPLPIWVAAAATTEISVKTIGLWIAVACFMTVWFYFSEVVEDNIWWMPTPMSYWLITVGFSAGIQYIFLSVSSIATWGAFKGVVLWWTGAFVGVMLVFLLVIILFAFWMTEWGHLDDYKWEDDE